MTERPQTADDRLLDEEASWERVAELHAAGYLEAEARNAAWAMLRRSRAWWQWTDRLLLVLGAALVLSGVIFFFAYNWAEMGRFPKFGLLQAAMLACLAGCWWLGLDRLPGKVLLTAAGILVGVVLAVYGQTYQTGADPYELFQGWALLILAWVIIGRFGALWLVWLVLVNTALVLYWGQVLEPNDAAEWQSLFLVLGLLNGAFAVSREWAERVGWDWASRWLRWPLLATALGWLAIPSVAFLADEGREPFLEGLALAVLLAYLACGWIYYRYRSPDLLSLTLCVTCLCLLVLTLTGNILFDLLDEGATFLLFGLLVVGVVSAATFWLRLTSLAMSREENG